MRPVLRILLRSFWILLVFELGAWLALGSLMDQRPSYDTLPARQRELCARQVRGLEGQEEAQRAEHELEMRHPYLAFIAAGSAPHEDQGITYLASRSLGDPDAPVFQEEPFVLGVAGGSVTANLVRHHGPALLERLRNSTQLAGRDLQLVCLASPGHKQPQSTMALGYLTTLGVRFDALLLLDGFNEVALHVGEAARVGQHPSYPRQWVQRVGFSREQRSALGRYDLLHAGRANAAQAMLDSPLRWSWMRQLAWFLKDAKAAEAYQRIERELAGLGSLEIERTGPRRIFEEAAPLMRELAYTWEEGSRMMAVQCAEQGAHFLHFLQPNQYDLGPDEEAPPKSESYSPDSHNRIGVELGYPLLRAASERLRAEGIAFFDLGRILDELPGPHYVDDCCHLSKPAAQHMLDAMVEALLSHLELPR